jgi:hypothetical protein
MPATGGAELQARHQVHDDALAFEVDVFNDVVDRWQEQLALFSLNYEDVACRWP